MATNTSRLQESTGTVTGPHLGFDRDGGLDHRYWRCERCGLESTDSRLREGCFRCRASAARRAADAEREETSRDSNETRRDRNATHCDQNETHDRHKIHDQNSEETDARRA